MNEVNIILEGTIDEFVPMGDVIQYTGTILKQGTWRGIDGHTIHYEDLHVLKEAAPTFTGSQLVHGHGDKTQKSVRGFNSVAWFDGESVKNRGYIFEPKTVKQIKAGKYPMGQSMEASVFVDANMKALKVVGRRVAIGLERAAVQGAQRHVTKEVRLEKMKKEEKDNKDNKFADAFKTKLDAIMTDEEKEDKPEAIMEIFAELMENPSPEEEVESKFVLLTDKKFAELKAKAEAKPDTSGSDDVILNLQTRLGVFEESVKRKQLVELEAKIKTHKADFDVKTYLEGVEDHVMQVRMLTSYLGAWQEVAPILPKPGVADVKLEDADLDKYSVEVFGEKFNDILGSITGVEIEAVKTNV